MRWPRADSDARVLPLCPCLNYIPPESLGWTISIGILSAIAVYLGGGVVFGRYSYATDEEKAKGLGGVLLTPRPDSHSSCLPSSHPHFEYFVDTPGLLADGLKFSLVKLGIGAKEEEAYDSLGQDDQYEADLAARQPSKAERQQKKVKLTSSGEISTLQPKKKKSPVTAHPQTPPVDPACLAAD